MDKIILTGNVNLECPDHIKIVRIFTSSTFSDTENERNYLMEKVYPRLRDFCSERGYHFQVVDMRWGVRDERTYDQMTTDLCLKELDRCIKFSTGPYLTAFVSHKYGWRPAPRIISKIYFEKFLEETKNTDDHKFLKSWYLEDTNRLKPAYILQPVGDIITDFHSSDEKKKKNANDQWWNKDSPRLQELTRSLANKLLSPKEAHIFLRSVTEIEIRKSVFEDNSVKDHCLWFKRTILNIDHTSKSAPRFQENPVGKDKESQKLLEDLKLEMSAKLGDNVLSYDIEWTSKGVDPDKKEHRSYLEKFGNEFEKELKKLIEKGIAKRNMPNSNKRLYEEVIQHTLFCQEKCKYFLGRNDILNKIQEYVQGGDTNPLIVHGESGSGKTSIMAKAAKEISERTKNRATIILRFIGTTLNSSDANGLMTSIIQQIQVNYNYSEPISTDDKELQKQFHDSLKKGTAEKPLIVILDALDQLDVKFGNRKLDLLLNKEPLPKHTKLILSTLPEENCLSHLKSCIKRNSQFLEVNRLEMEDVERILSHWLEANGRKLTEEQREIVLQAFDKCPLPLYLKLTFDIAYEWHSYSRVSDKDLKHTVGDIIANLFEPMEVTHGKILISHTFGYLTLAENGLSFGELEDILSCDEEVLNDCLQYWTPPRRRLPPLLLFRILDDLREYLVYRGSDGIPVIQWYHQQFIEAAKRMYCSDPKKNKYLYEQLADYFSGKWANGIQKPFIDKKGEPDVCDRLVARQPIKFKDEANLRKLNNLPRFLVKAKMIKRLKEEVLFNFDFLFTKIKATSVREVVNDFLLAREQFPQEEAICNVSDALHLSQTALSHDPDQLPTQLLGRLDVTPELHPLIEACRKCDVPHFEPDRNFLSPSNTQLLLLIRSDQNSVSDPFDISSDRKKVVVGLILNDTHLKFWSVPDGALILESGKFSKRMKIVQFCDDDQLVAMDQGNRIDFIFTKTASFSHSLTSLHSGFFKVCGKKKSWIILQHRCNLIICDIKTSEKKYQIGLGDLDNIVQVAVSDKYVSLLMRSTSPKILAFNLLTGSEHHWNVEEFISLQLYVNKHRSIALCPNSDLLYLVGDKCLLSYNMIEERVQTLWGFQPLQYNTGISTDGQFVYSKNQKGITVYEIQTRKEMTEISENDLNTMVIRMFDIRFLVTRSMYGELRIWDCTRNFKKNDSNVASPQLPVGAVTAVNFFPNYRYLLFQINAKDHTNCYVYDVSKGEILMSFKLMIYGSKIYPISDTKILVLNKSNKVKVVNIENNSITTVFKDVVSSDSPIVPIKDGTEILTTTFDHKNIRVYHTRSGYIIYEIECFSKIPIGGISISESGNIAVAYPGPSFLLGDSNYYIIDLNQYMVKHVVRPENIPSCIHIAWNQGMIKVSRDDSLLVLGRVDHNRICSTVIWNIEQRNFQCVMSDQTEYSAIMLNYSATFMQNKFVLTVQKGTINVFSSDSGTLLKKIDLKTGNIPKVLSNKNLPYFLSCTRHSVVLWSLDSFEKIIALDTDQTLGLTSLSQNGDVIVARERGSEPPITLLKNSKSDPHAFLQMEEINYKKLGFDNIIDLTFPSFRQ